MIPAKVFLESLRILIPDKLPRLHVNLLLNSIFYDEIKQFQTRYLCITSHDVLSIELQAQTGEVVLARMNIADLAKVVLQQRSIQIRFDLKGQAIHNQVTLKLSFEPLAAYKKRRHPENSNRTIEEALPASKSDREGYPMMDVSFSHRDKNQFSPSVEPLGNSRTFEQTGHTNQLLQTLTEEEGESLENLAQQREKILQELFGKFKKVK